MKVSDLKMLGTFAVAAMLVSSMPAFASETDARIESSAKESYVFKTYLKNDAIKVESKDGVVSLLGNVNQESHKTLAHETVSSLPGVVRVDNRLELKGEQTPENSDAWIAMQAKTALLFRRNVSAVNTEVYVQQGILTLRGEADSQAQKTLTEEYARDIAGVKNVQNEMTVKTSEGAPQTLGEKIDDASITAQIKSSLLWHRATNLRNTKVGTTDGVVTLSGIAENTAERDLVTKLVNDINGVNRVVNNMSVA